MRPGSASSASRNLAGFEDFLAGEANVRGGCGKTVPIRNGSGTPLLSNFPSLLRGVIFIGKASLRLAFDDKRIGLDAKREAGTRILEVAGSLAGPLISRQ